MKRRDGRPDTGLAAHVGTCPTCGKRCYGSKDEAKKAARQIHPASRLNVYRCGTYWHLGHLPLAVVHGDLPRSEISGRRS